MIFLSASPEDTLSFGEQLGQLLRDGDHICLTGDLGAGKTLLVQGLAKGLAIKEEVTSPTFTILQVYSGPVTLYHFDLYRLEYEDQLDDIGFDEYTGNTGAAVIEWSEKFPDRLPEDRITITITKTRDSERLLAVTAAGCHHRSLCEELKGKCSWLLIQPH